MYYWCMEKRDQRVPGDWGLIHGMLFVVGTAALTLVLGYLVIAGRPSAHREAELVAALESDTKAMLARKHEREELDALRRELAARPHRVELEAMESDRIAREAAIAACTSEGGSPLVVDKGHVACLEPSSVRWTKP